MIFKTKAHKLRMQHSLNTVLLVKWMWNGAKAGMFGLRIY